MEDIKENFICYLLMTKDLIGKIVEGINDHDLFLAGLHLGGLANQIEVELQLLGVENGCQNKKNPEN